MPLLLVELVALVCLVMVDPSVSIAQMKAVHPSPVKMMECAQKRQASHTFTVSVEVGSKASAVSRLAPLQTLLYLHAL